MPKSSPDEGTGFTVFQRIRDKALQDEGIQLDREEMDELMRRIGRTILNHARADDASIFIRSGCDELQRDGDDLDADDD